MNPSTDPQQEAPLVEAEAQRHWFWKRCIMLICLTIWAFVSLGCGILFADFLNQYSLAGFPLGFWFAQQGSIITFVLLILIYGWMLNRLDRKYYLAIRHQKQKHDT